MLKNKIKKIYISTVNRRKNVKLGENTNVSISTSFEGMNVIGNNTTFFGSIGRGSYIGEDCHICANIGRFTCISSRVVTVRGTHPLSDWITIHPAFYSTSKQCGVSFVNSTKFEESSDYISIGNDVWIGDSAILLDNITISNGAVIAAGAVVTKDVPPYAVVAGVPARIIKYRFNEDVINKLMRLKWWDKSVDWLYNHAEFFDNTNNIELLFD